MIGFRVAHKYIERLPDQELHGLYEAALKDDGQEALVIQYLIICELNKRKEKFMKEIKEALNKLGAEGHITTKWITTDRIAVYLHDEYFGIWDTVRKTFVD